MGELPDGRERITRQVGAVQLQSLTPLQVESLYATLLERRGAGGRSLAPKTVRNRHIVLRRALADAEGLGLVTRNPAAVAKTVSEGATGGAEDVVVGGDPAVLRRSGGRAAVDGVRAVGHHGHASR